MLAAQLARRGIRSVLIERDARVGLGAAYSTTDPVHLLNVPAHNMSAWADDAGHFARLAGDPAAFAQRRDFGAYLRSILQEAVESGCTRVANGCAVAAERQAGCWSVAIDGDEQVTASALVLATGNQPPGRLAALEAAGDRLIDNPWGAKARAAIEDAAASGEAVLIAGTGLTMVDIVLSLDSAGHQGRIVALSRRGLAPRGHGAHQPAPVDAEELPTGSALALFCWLRRRAAETGWRAAIDALRPHSQALWQSLGTDEKRRFLRHARPWWDVHRHRIAPQIAEQLAALIGDGRLEVVAGRIVRSSRSDGGVEIEFRRRGREAVSSERFAYVFNCTGPLHSLDKTARPAAAVAAGEGAAKVDELGIGLEVDAALAGRGRGAGVGAWAPDQRAVLGNHRRAGYQEPGGASGRGHCNGGRRDEPDARRRRHLRSRRPSCRCPTRSPRRCGR